MLGQFVMEGDIDVDNMMKIMSMKMFMIMTKIIPR